MSNLTNKVTSKGAIIIAIIIAGCILGAFNSIPIVHGQFDASNNFGTNFLSTIVALGTIGYLGYLKFLKPED